VDAPSSETFRKRLVNSQSCSCQGSCSLSLTHCVNTSIGPAVYWYRYRTGKMSPCSFVLSGWRLQSGLHSNNQSWCTSVYTGPHPHTLLSSFCHVADVKARQQLRSGSSSSLIVSCTRLLTVSDRAFPVVAAHVWNSLPDLVTSVPSVAVFRSWLKTHLFNISYPCDCTVPAQWLLLICTL